MQTEMKRALTFFNSMGGLELRPFVLRQQLKIASIVGELLAEEFSGCLERSTQPFSRVASSNPIQQETWATGLVLVQ